MAPAGMTTRPSVHGVVTKSQGCGGFGKNGKLEITFGFLEAPDGAHIPFADPDLKKHGNSSQLGTSARYDFLSTSSIISEQLMSFDPRS